MAMITKRSNHIPMFTKMEITNSAVRLVRTFLNQRIQGRNQLHTFMVHPAHQKGPKARYQNACRSGVGPPYQAMKYSVKYARPTIMPVRRQSFARFSKCRMVTTSSRWKSFRIGTRSEITIATPE